MAAQSRPYVLPLSLTLTYYRLRMPCIICLLGYGTSCRLYILHHTMKPQYTPYAYVSLFLYSNFGFIWQKGSYFFGPVSGLGGPFTP